ncbi:unnamed protein product [Oikopleura dioica]|uniref:Uncharacterized protein n=1 Tax=Oikopleura dioica TaxID=34765 RepID=E4XCA9_OIKDI|nr:unnamed protein product [Oikopleura dioica]
MAWQQQNYGGDQGYGQGQQYGQQFNQQYGNGQLQQGYNQGSQNWKSGPANMDAGPGHFGMSNTNPDYGYGSQRYNGNRMASQNTMPQRRGAPRPMGQNNSQKKDSNKSINAVEVKSYINAWSTKQKLKPTYEYVQEGMTPQNRVSTLFFNSLFCFSKYYKRRP